MHLCISCDDDMPLGEFASVKCPVNVPDSGQYKALLLCSRRVDQRGVLENLAHTRTNVSISA